MADEGTRSDVAPIDDYVAENYEALLADKDRNLTPKKLADQAEEAGDLQLAAWARAKAAGKNADVTPTDATDEAPKKVTRRTPKNSKTDEEKEVEFPLVEPAEGVDEPEKADKK